MVVAALRIGRPPASQLCVAPLKWSRSLVSQQELDRSRTLEARSTVLPSWNGSTPAPRRTETPRASPRRSAKANCPAPLATLVILYIITEMPKLVDHNERRAEIAKAAASAIDEVGLDRVRLVDVAKRASCTTGAVRHYFPDKNAVLGAALEHVLTNLTTYIPGAIPRRKDAPPVESFLEALAEILPIDEARRRDWRIWIAFCGRAVRMPALAKQHRDAYAQIQQSLANAMVDVGVAHSVPDAQQLAVSVVSALDGLGLRAILEPEEWSANRLQSMLYYQLAPLLRADRAVDIFDITPNTQEISA